MDTILFLNLYLALFLANISADDNFFHLSGEFNNSSKIGRLSHNPFDVFNSTPSYEDQLAHFSSPSIELQKTRIINSTKHATGETKPKCTDFKHYDCRLGSSYLRDAASSLGLYLQGVANNELGAPMLQGGVDKIGFVSRERNTTGTLRTLSNIIRSKIVKFKETLENLVNIIETEGENITNADNFIRCCSIPAHQFKYDQHFGGAAVMPALSCSHQSSSSTVSDFLSSLMHSATAGHCHVCPAHDYTN